MEDGIESLALAPETLTAGRAAEIRDHTLRQRREQALMAKNKIRQAAAARIPGISERIAQLAHEGHSNHTVCFSHPVEAEALEAVFSGRGFKVQGGVDYLVIEW